MELYSDRWKQLYMTRMDDVTDPEMIIHYRIGKTEEIVYSSVFRKSDFSFVQPDLWLVNRVWSQLVVPIVFVWGWGRWGLKLFMMNFILCAFSTSVRETGF